VSDAPQMPGIPAELYQAYTTDDNATRVQLVLEDGTLLSVDFAPDSDEAAELLELLQRLVNAKLRSTGSRGVEITGFSPEDSD